MLRLPGPIVSVDWLQSHLHDPALRVADVRWSLAKLYEGSWSDWSSDPSRPVAVGSEP